MGLFTKPVSREGERMKRRKLRVQIAFHYLKVSALSLGLMGFVLYISISSVVLSETTSSTKTAVEKSGMYIELYIERLKAVSGIIASDPQLIAYFSSTDREPAVKDSILQRIENTMATDAYIQSVVLVSKDGEVVSNEQGLIMGMSSNMMKEEWYVKAVQSGSMPVLTSARMQQFSMDKDNWVISISREITGQNGQNIGVLLIDIQYKVIEDFLEKLDLGNGGFSFILNERGEVVYHQDPSYFEQPEKQQALQQIVADKDNYDHTEKTLTHTYRLNNADWTFVGVSSQDGLMMVKRQLLEIFLLIGTILFLLAACSVAVFADRITKPFRKLEQAMQDIELGLKKVPVDEKGCFEAESLSRHFNEMLVRIEQLMEEIKDKEKRLRTSEINVLHSQINPHFLYNALDTIVWMAEFNESEKVIEMTKALAQFFRLSLNGGNELTTIGKELDHVRHYLFIQKERYGEKLQYQIQCEDSLQEVQIPKILVQPIVENAIYHGIRPLEGTGQVVISAARCEDGIILEVEDNGVGYNTDKVQEVEENMAKLGGVGIQNVDERVKLYYGTDYGVRIASQVGVGTKVNIVLPHM